jgi:hypothetical protein
MTERATSGQERRLTSCLPPMEGGFGAVRAKLSGTVSDEVCRHAAAALVAR